MYHCFVDVTVCVHACVCMCARVCVCVFVCASLCLCVCVRENVCVYVHLRGDEKRWLTRLLMELTRPPKEIKADLRSGLQ